LIQNTLKKRNLSGAITLVDGRVTPQLAAPLARGGQITSATNQINSVQDLDADIAFEGSTIRVNRFAATLGRRGRPGAAAGTLTLAGNIDISDLDIKRISLTPDEIAAALTEQAAVAAAAAPSGAGSPPPTTRWSATGGNVRLDARFDDFAPDVDNVSGGGQIARATLRGTVRLRGPLPGPTLATEQREPLEVRNAFLRLSLAGRRARLPPAPLRD
jgi:hypothetical protein